MRPSSRLLATAARYLTPHAPTGIAGLKTHPAPRSALIYFYSKTLEKLGEFPASSAYRKATEALTKQRLAVVESVKPEGYEAWVEKVKALTTDEHLTEIYGTKVDDIVKKAHLYNLQFGEYADEDASPQKDWEGSEHEEIHDMKWTPEPPLSAEQ
jgi:hypothetical protein